MAIASFGTHQQPPVGLMLKCFPVLRLDPEGYCSPSVMLAAALASKRGIPLAKALAAFSSTLSSPSSSPDNQHQKKNNNDDDDDQDDDGNFSNASSPSSSKRSSSTLSGMSHFRISPEHLNLLASCFKRNVFRKNEPICWSPPPVYGKSNNNNNNNVNNNNNNPSSYDSSSKAKNSLLDTEWWYECDAQVHLIQSGIVRVLYRNQRRDKSQALLLQQLSQQQQQQQENNNQHHHSTTNKKQNQKSSSLKNTSNSTTSSTSTSINNNNNTHLPFTSSSSSREHLRSTLAGVETLTTGKILGLEALVPEQAKRYVAIADSDVATWSAPVRAIMDVLIQINPFGDPDADKNNNNNDYFSSGENNNRRSGKNNNNNTIIMSPTSATSTSNTTTGTGFGSEQILLQQKVEKESVMMLGKLMQRMVLLRKQEIFMVQTPPTPIFLRSCAPLLYTWSDGGLTELCRTLSAVFVEKGNVVPLRKISSTKSNKLSQQQGNKKQKSETNATSSSSHNWFFVGGTSQVPPEIVIPATTAPPSHVDYVYFVIHGAVSIMGRKVYLNNSNNNNTSTMHGDGDQQQQQLVGSPASSKSGGGGGVGGSSSRQKLVLLDNMKPGQSFGVASCLLGTLLDTAIPGAIASSLSAAGTPVEKFMANNTNTNNNSSFGSGPANPVNQTPAARQFFANGQHVSQAAGLVTAHSNASNIAQSQLSHLVGIELHATQDSVLWRLEKNVLMHVLAHEHIGTLLSPFGLYQQLGKPPGQ